MRALRADGALMGVAGEPVQVRNHENAGVRTTPGAFMRSELPVAGFAVIEAESAEEAAELVSKSPCSVAYGVVEVSAAPGHALTVQSGYSSLRHERGSSGWGFGSARAAC